MISSEANNPFMAFPNVRKCVDTACTTQDGYYDMGFNAAEESKHNIKKTDRQYLKLF